MNGFLWEALPQIVIYAASFMVIGTFWVRHHRMFDMCRVVDGGSLVLNLVFLGFVSLLTFPSDLLYFDDQSTSAVIAFSAVAGAATLREVGLWRHLRRHRELLLPDIPEERIASLTTWRFWSLGVFIISILVSLFFPRITVLMLLALLPLYEFVHHRRYHRMTALFIYFATTKSGALGGLASLLVNKLSEERQVLVRRLELGMTLVMRVLLLLSLG